MQPFRTITYEQARSDYFGKQQRKTEKALHKHCGKMADGTLDANDYTVQDKANELGWIAEFYKNAAKMYSDDYRKDLGTICICAVRYSLGRMTYMPNLVQTFIMDNIGMLFTSDIDIMIRDVSEFGGVDCRKSAYGADYDYRDWMKFKEKLEEIKKWRKE